MAKLFFDVFPTLDVSGDMKKILSEMEVTKVGMNHERDHIRVYLLGSHLIHKNNITQLEKSIEELILFDNTDLHPFSLKYLLLNGFF